MIMSRCLGVSDGDSETDIFSGFHSSLLVGKPCRLPCRLHPGSLQQSVQGQVHNENYVIMRTYAERERET
jgi:hypothetical protein